MNKSRIEILKMKAKRTGSRKELIDELSNIVTVSMDSFMEPESNDLFCKDLFNTLTQTSNIKNFGSNSGSLLSALNTTTNSVCGVYPQYEIRKYKRPLQNESGLFITLSISFFKSHLSILFLRTFLPRTYNQFNRRSFLIINSNLLKCWNEG